VQIEKILNELLDRRQNEGNLRNLLVRKNLIDFTSNDYLGLSRSKELLNKVDKDYQNNEIHCLGATGSRLLSGNSEYIEKLELYLGDFWGDEALIFNSGYDANLGIFSSVPKKGDVLIMDEFIHACIIDGARLSGAFRERFKHNNLDSLKEKLTLASKNQGNIFVAIESLYSMDGDFAPLTEMAILCEEFGANLIVDEAHSTGIYGLSGKGRISELGLEKKVFARIFTFGKALGVHGAVIIGKPFLKNYLINFARTFIYTTALPLHSLVSISSAWQFLRDNHDIAIHLMKNIRLFQKNLDLEIPILRTNPDFPVAPIQALKIKGNLEAKQFANHLVKLGFDIRPILFPSVAKGEERVRICLHSFNSNEEILKLTSEINKIYPKFI
jgi:8-amino-7-oxononanoate synthase